MIDLSENRLLRHNVLNLLQPNNFVLFQNLQSPVLSSFFVTAKAHATERSSPCTFRMWDTTTVGTKCVQDLKFIQFDGQSRF